MDENQAIEQLLKGDFDALTWLVERFQLKALRTAFLITGERSLAEDVVQAKFVQLPKSIHSFDPQRSFEPWFLRSVANAAVTAVNRDRRTIPFTDVLPGEHWLEQLIETDTIDQKLRQRELEEEVWIGLQKLSPGERAAIVMRYFLEMSEEEMARHGDVARGTIKWRLNAARGKLKRWFKSDPRKEIRE